MLKSIGFELNPYEPCVAKKMINGKQFALCWHVDDVKASHADPQEVDKFVQWLHDTYEDDVGQVKVSRGKAHDYLGMTLDYSSPGEVKMNMIDYVKKMVEDFPEDDVPIAKTPATNHFLK